MLKKLLLLSMLFVSSSSFGNEDDEEDEWQDSPTPHQSVETSAPVAPPPSPEPLTPKESTDFSGTTL